MLRRSIGLAMAAILLAFGLVVGSAAAIELGESVRTVPLNAQGDTTVLSVKQLQ